MPGASHSRFRIGSAALVQAQTTSAPATASSKVSNAVAPVSSANACACSGSRLAIRTSWKSRTRPTARGASAPWTPAPRIASTRESSRASARVETAAPPPVRMAVMCVPSITAIGVPVSASKTAISAWCEGSCSGKSVTSFAASTPSTYPGIAPEQAMRPERGDPRRHGGAPGAQLHERPLERVEELVDVEEPLHLLLRDDEHR